MYGGEDGMKRGRGGWRWRELKRRLCLMVFCYLASGIAMLFVIIVRWKKDAFFLCRVLQVQWVPQVNKDLMDPR